MTEFVVASHNAKKIKELNAILEELNIAVNELPKEAPEPIEDGKTFEENALIKARSAMQATGLPAIADDSGICVDALSGAPGIYSARYCDGTDKDRNAFLLANMQGKENRACRFVSAVACVFPDGREIIVRGECEGVLLEAEKGEGGFGYDPLFFVPEYECTFGELSQQIKNQISHRARALALLKEKLKNKI